MDILEQERRAFEDWVMEAFKFRPKREKGFYESEKVTALWVGWMARAKHAVGERQ